MGTEPTDEQKKLISTLGFAPTKFKYFTAEQVENDLEISRSKIEFVNRF